MNASGRQRRVYRGRSSADAGRLPSVQQIGLAPCLRIARAAADRVLFDHLVRCFPATPARTAAINTLVVAKNGR